MCTPADMKPSSSYNFAFRICLPHQSVTTILSGAPLLRNILDPPLPPPPGMSAWSECFEIRRDWTMVWHDCIQGNKILYPTLKEGLAATECKRSATIVANE